ncbi:MAG TPA: hypothetical protein VNK41_11555 [Vicinamibacterales bacterium]|nr:hypothetical protein [Vicinamibacterales bacterium]
MRLPELPGGIAGGLIRFLALIAGACLLVGVTAVPLGLATGTALQRSVSLGFYILGGFVGVLGLLAGNRGPFRRVDEDAPLSFGRRLRRATLDELLETINLSVVMVAIGIVLLAIGVAIDDRYRLF